MRKKILLVSVVLLVSFSLFADPSIYLRAGYGATFDTNIFSYPLVKNTGEDDSYLAYRVENPFLYRLDHDIKGGADIYFSPKGRTGISLSCEIGIPIKAVTYTPSSTDVSSDWHYIKADATDVQPKKLIFSFGPSFRAVMGNFDLGMNIRFALGSYDLFENDLVLGLCAEGFVNYFLTNSFFLFANLGLDSKFMSFYLSSEKQVYREHYIMAAVSATVGLGVKFGPRGE